MMDFLGVAIGNVAANYKIEADDSAPLLALAATRSGAYVVLSGHPIANTAIAAATVTNEIETNGGPDGLIDHTKIKSIIKDNTEVGVCSCIGYMLIKLTLTGTRVETRKVAPTGKDAQKQAWATEQVVTQVNVSDYIVSTAYNVTRESGKATYTVHNKNSKGGQVHVEQICAHRLRAFLGFVKGIRLGNSNAAAIDFSHLSAKGYVKFRGQANSGGSLTAACNGCVGVWDKLRTDYKFLKDISLEQD